MGLDNNNRVTRLHTSGRVTGEWGEWWCGRITLDSRGTHRMGEVGLPLVMSGGSGSVPGVPPGPSVFSSFVGTAPMYPGSHAPHYAHHPRLHPQLSVLHQFAISDEALSVRVSVAAVRVVAVVRKLNSPLIPCLTPCTARHLSLQH
ncbi:hypothetical protein GWK47_046813 [Chionoecetes opilio]|uniref:Uncharacterized protein n=1 Tax=Chionoecetes opilio TaxID=41210 RepID=A0A8J4YCM9_CHIOP|nr:hypothetical protein GWK47_046813 [Chionoecetes opilio]